MRKQLIDKINYLKKPILKNEQLVLGLAVGALVMLPTGLYISERMNNHQASKQSDVTQQTGIVNESSNSRGLTPVTGQNTDQANNQNSNNGSKPSNVYAPTPTPNSAYKPPVCIKTPTSYKTHIQLATWLGSNQTKVDGGKEGYAEACAADSTGYAPHKVPLNPVDKYVYVGTGGISTTTPPRTSPPEPDQYSRIVADCSQQLAVHGNQEAYQLCVNTLSRYFGL